MCPGDRRPHVPALLLAAIAALLVFATAASAETRTGESSTVIRENFPTGEVTLVKADASYESTAGSIVFHVTTATGAAHESEGSILAVLTTTPNCAGKKTGKAIIEPLFQNLVAGVADSLASPTANGLAGSFTAPQELPATKSVSDTTTTLSLASGTIANKEYDCAIIAAIEPGEGEGGELDEEFPGLEEGPGATFLSFPISVPPSPPPAPPVVTAAAAGPTPPAAAPAAPPVLSIGKLKPLTLAAGKSGTVKVKITNSGGSATALGSLRVKNAEGVLVKPERQQLPVLAPGASRTLSVRVQLGAKAKSKSTLTLTAAASGVTATGSFIAKLKKG